MPTRCSITLSSVLALSIAQGVAQAQIATPRLTEVAANYVRMEVRLPFPATVEILYGEEIGNWTGRAESLTPDEFHDLRLGKLSANRQYFYQVSLDAMPGEEILSFRSGRSWVTRNATMLVSGDVAGGDSGERDLADELFRDQSDILVLLGGGGSSDELVDLHRRTMADRLVLTTGGPDDAEALRSLAFSDLAIALAGDSPLVTATGPASASSWIGQVLPTIEGACWKVAASALEVQPGSSEARTLLDAAQSMGIHVLLTRGPEPLLTREGSLLWVVVSDPDGRSSGARNFARLAFNDGTLSATLMADSKELARDEFTKDCPLPRPKVDENLASLGDDEFGFGDEVSEDGDGGDEECDY